MHWPYCFLSERVEDIQIVKNITYFSFSMSLCVCGLHMYVQVGLHLYVLVCLEARGQLQVCFSISLYLSFKIVVVFTDQALQ